MLASRATNAACCTVQAGCSNMTPVLATQSRLPRLPAAEPHVVLVQHGTYRRALGPQGQRQTVCCATPASSSGSAEDVKEAMRTLKMARSGITVDPAYATGGTFLKTIGFSNPAEISRVLDIAMNPNSLFIDYARGNRSKNASARSLDVDKDMMPVVDFFLTKGVSKGDVIKIISGHPPVLSYDVNLRLEPFWGYMAGLGIEDVGAAIAGRPTLLGLHMDNIRKITGYLQSIETPPEEIIKLLLQSI